MSLIKNELIKIFSQLSFKIMMILVLVIALIIPYITTLANHSPSSTIEDEYNNAIWNLESIGETDRDDCEIAFEIAYYETLSETADFYLKNANENWKFSKTMTDSDRSTLQNLLMAQKTIFLYRKFGEEIAYCWHIHFLDDYIYDYLGENVPLIPYIEEEITDKEDYTRYRYSNIDYSLIDFDVIEQEVTGRIDAVKANIIALNATEVLTEEKVIVQANLSELKKDAVSAQKAYDANPSEINERKLKEFDFTIAQTNNIIKLYDILLNTNKTPDDWQYNAIKALNNSIDTYIDSLPVTEKEYNENLMLQYDGIFSAQFPSYEEYKKTREKDCSNILAGAEIIMTAVKENECLPVFLEISTKSNINSAMSSQFRIIGLFTVILAALVISTEYSSGTIRLLLIRPKTRKKILASKYCAVLFCALLLSVISFIIISVVTILLNGIGDIFANDIIQIANVNIVLPSLAGFGIKLILAFFQIILLSSITILIAILVKKSALSITLPIIILFVSRIAQIFIPSLTIAKPEIKYTILPYFDLGSLFVSPSSIFADADSLVQILLGDISIMGMLRLDIFIGIIIYAIHIALVIHISSVAFKKQQI